MFVDKTTHQFRAGKGGSGCISFRRERYIPKGGPDGGSGGRGGSIVLVSDGGSKSLAALKYRYLIKAPAGGHGQGALKHGKNGKDIRLSVPVGTVVKRSETGEVLFDFTRKDQELVIARGGKGGRGNATFKSSVNRTPRQYTGGEPGEVIHVTLELKLIAFAGLIGFPNAGKSTLIARTTGARPRIADYPFTTIQPNLGVIYLGYRSCVIADIPGIIQNAHQGEGMGLDFLRHVERTKVLIYLIDISVQRTHPPLQTFEILQNEVISHKKSLANHPFFIVLNKTDLSSPDKAENRQMARYCLDHGIPLLKISALKGTHLDTFKERVFQYLDND